MSKRMMKKIGVLLLLSGGLMLAEVGSAAEGFELRLQSNECADQHGACRLQADHGTAVFSFDHQVEALKPFTVDLELSQWPAAVESVSVNFKMAAMEMGKNRYRLLKQDNGHWQSRVVLPICGMGGSEWLVELEIKSSSASWHAALPFRLKSGS